MVVAVPTYSIFKEITKFLAKLYENHKEAHKEAKELEKQNQIKIRKPDWWKYYLQNKRSLNSYCHKEAEEQIW